MGLPTLPCKSAAPSESHVRWLELGLCYFFYQVMTESAFHNMIQEIDGCALDCCTIVRCAQMQVGELHFYRI